MRNLHLKISVIIVVPAAFIYGVFPARMLPYFFDFDVQTVDLTNIFRAIMCLYLACAVTWIMGIAKSKYWETATIVNIIFMLGLGIGRILSSVLDGPPSMLFLFGMFGEVALGLFALFQLKKYAPERKL